jgi:alpha-L-fucosidase
MNHILTILTLLLLVPVAALHAADGPVLRKEYQERQRRVDQWYAPARFGLFYTWGMLTGSKGSSRGSENPLRYDTVAAFEAAAQDPDAIAANMVSTVKKIGARYLIFTVFHSCGRYFVTYPSDVSGYRCKATKDYFGALVNRCHQEGVPLILYMGADNYHAFIKDGPFMTEEMRDQKNVFAAVKQMINELIDRHGEKISGFWFDGQYQDDLGELIHARLPKGIVIHNNEVTLSSSHVDFGSTEFLCGRPDPEYSRPSGLLKPPLQGSAILPKRDFNEDIPQAGGWWYQGLDEKSYGSLPYVKDPTYLVKQMVSSLGQRRQWNFALGIGPMIDGKLPSCFDPMIANMGWFLAWAGESIYDTMGGEGSALNPGWWNNGAYGSITVSRKDPHILYIHVTTPPSKGWLQVQNNGYQVASVVDLRSGKPVDFGDSGLLTVRNEDWKDVTGFGAKVFKVTLVASNNENRAKGRSRKP